MNNSPVSKISSDDGAFSVIDANSIESYITNNVINNEVDTLDMASLSNFILLGQTLSKSEEPNGHEEDHLGRLSLAYERLHSMPKLLSQEVAPFVKILDISHNEFETLDFLTDFKCLSTLICDHNSITSKTSIPFLPKLEMLWLNHCKIAALYPWAKRLQTSCPNLKFLSLMGNPVAPSYLNGGNFYEYLQYRLFIISLFPNLIHLDDRPVTADQRKEAERLYRKPLVDRLLVKTQSTLPEYLRQISQIVSDVLTPTPSFATPEKNVIV